MARDVPHRQAGYGGIVITMAMAFLAAIWIQALARVESEPKLVLDGVHVANSNLARVIAGSVSRNVIDSSGSIRSDMLALLVKLDLGEQGEIAFLEPDGREMVHVSSRGAGQRAERSVAGLMVAGSKDGVRTFLGSSDSGEQRLYAAAPSDGGRFHVVVSRPLGEVLKAHRESRQRHFLWAWFATGLVVLAASSLVVLFGRQRRTYDALHRTENVNAELIGQLRDEKERAYKLAYYDQLTGLANRGFFRAMAAERLAGTRRRRRQAAIAFIDLDRFKTINDSYGHHIGDMLLVEVGRRLRRTLRESDSVARFGGDEFVVQVVDVEQVEHLNPLLGKIIEAIAAPMMLEGNEISVQAAIGVAIHPQDGESIEELLKNADAAMYEAKRAGQGNFRFFDAQLNARVQRYSNLEQRFRIAVDLGEFEMHYQPRMDTSGYRIVSLEALVRWRHPEYGLVFPGDFIPIAEETGFIVHLGEVIVDRVCRQIAEWRAAGLHVPRVAINASARQLRDDGFIHLIRWHVERSGIAFSDLEVEVTESCVMENPETSARVLGELVSLGLKISLDDYGTGYSSLSSIKRLPLSAIKIDRSFVKDIGIDPNDDVIVASTISMSHGLGLRVVAEGVETRSQLIRLRVLGCEEVQGYLFSRPIPPGDMARMLVRGICEPRIQEEVLA